MGALHGLTLGVADPERALAFYPPVLGWCPPVVPDAVWPGARLAFAVADLPAAVAAVRAAGCQATDAGEARDPFGLPFTLVAGAGGAGAAAAQTATAPAATAPAALGVAAAGAADRFTALLYVPDAAAARAFYGPVLGGEPPVQVLAGRGRPGVIPTYRVADPQRAAVAVRAAGGSATGAGLCGDDQGLGFYLAAAAGPV